MHTLSGKVFNGTVVNHALSSLRGGSLEITLTVPYILFLISNLPLYLKFFFIILFFSLGPSL